ncbi:MAG: Iron-sulfur cluster repair protein YtfE [bacterium ADurb.Bin429]|nr:MAG: Iron-sulfur cluster repair protein YtfE [bacterium ADurb.Bin429]
MSTQAITPTTRVSDIAAAYPATLRMMESLGIDYCCGGKLPLETAAAEAHLPVETVIAVLETTIVQSRQSDEERNWSDAPIEELIDHIIATHHTYMHRELPRLEGIMALVGRVHGPAHGDVLEPLAEAFTSLKTELEAHLIKEEEVVFPAIARVVGGQRDESAVSGARELEDEHEAAGALLHEMHRLTDDFAVPDGVCATYEALYHDLQALEQDIHRHIHLENNVLFPRLLRLLAQG